MLLLNLAVQCFSFMNIPHTNIHYCMFQRETVDAVLLSLFHILYIVSMSIFLEVFVLSDTYLYVYMQ